MTEPPRRPAGQWTPAELGVHPVIGVTHLSALAEPADLARAARWAVGRASLDDPWDVARLLVALRTAGADEAVQVLLDRDPAGQVSLEHRWDVAWLLRELRATGAAEALGAAKAGRAAEAARALIVRVAPRASLGDPRYLTWLLRALQATGAAEALHALASRAVDGADLENMWEVTQLLAGLQEVGAAGPIRILAARAARGASLDDPQGVARLLEEHVRPVPRGPSGPGRSLPVRARARRHWIAPLAPVRTGPGLRSSGGPGAG